MQKNCSSDPTNPTLSNCVCENDLSNESQANCSESVMNKRSPQGPASVVNSKGVVGKFCQNILRTPPPVCDGKSKNSCMCPIGSSVTVDSNGGYYCKNNN
jgi:hypothetical protein